MCVCVCHRKCTDADRLIITIICTQLLRDRNPIQLALPPTESTRCDRNERSFGNGVIDSFRWQLIDRTGDGKQEAIFRVWLFGRLPRSWSWPGVINRGGFCRQVQWRHCVFLPPVIACPVLSRSSYSQIRWYCWRSRGSTAKSAVTGPHFLSQLSRYRFLRTQKLIYSLLSWAQLIIMIIIIMYIYHAVINALSAHMIHIDLHMIFYTHVEHSPTKTIYIK